MAPAGVAGNCGCSAPPSGCRAALRRQQLLWAVPRQPLTTQVSGVGGWVGQHLAVCSHGAIGRGGPPAGGSKQAKQVS